MVREEEIQQKYAYFQMLQQQIEQITQQVELMQQHTVDLEESSAAIEELAIAQVGGEVLAPIANGIFMKATLQESTTLLVNVGANTVVEKNSGQVLELLQEQKKELALRLVEAEEILQQLTNQAMKVYKEVEEHIR